MNPHSISSTIFLTAFQNLLEPGLSVSQKTSFKGGRRKGPPSLLLSCCDAPGCNSSFEKCTELWGMHFSASSRGSPPPVLPFFPLLGLGGPLLCLPTLTLGLLLASLCRILLCFLFCILPPAPECGTWKTCSGSGPPSRGSPVGAAPLSSLWSCERAS